MQGEFCCSYFCSSLLCTLPCCSRGWTCQRAQKEPSVWNDPRCVAAAAQLPASAAHAELQAGRDGEGSCRSPALGDQRHGEEPHVPRPVLKPLLHLECKHRHKDLAFMKHSIWQKRGSFVFLRCTYMKYIWQEKDTPHLHTCTFTRSLGRLL